MLKFFSDMHNAVNNNLPNAKPADANTIQSVLNVFFAISGAVAVFVIVLAGVRYILSHGDSRLIEQAKNQILYSLVGLVVIIMASTIVNFFMKSL